MQICNQERRIKKRIIEFKMNVIRIQRPRVGARSVHYSLEGEGVREFLEGDVLHSKKVALHNRPRRPEEDFVPYSVSLDVTNRLKEKGMNDIGTCLIPKLIIPESMNQVGRLP